MSEQPKLNSEQMKMMRSAYLKQMKDDVTVLELDSRFWEAKFKALHYKTQYAKLEAEIQEELQAVEKMMKDMQTEVLDNQGPLPSEETPN